MSQHLFKALKLGPVQLPNRVCFLAHRTNFGRKGRLTDRHISYYRRRAQGGCGLVIVGELSIHPGDCPWATMIEAFSSDTVADFKRLTGAVHDAGTPIFASLNHHGFQSNGAISRKETWGPSAMADVVFGEVSKAMESEDMATVVAAYSAAAEYVREGGFDGMEIDMGAESLLRQFLSPLSNQRQDEYGGSLENRMRFPLEVIDAVRRSAGSDLAVGIRLCIDEKFWGAISPEESLSMAQAFEKTGCIDYIQATLGSFYNLYLVMPTMHTPAGFAVDLAQQLKGRVSLPVIAAHHIEFPDMAEAILAERKADAVGFIRPLICDPDMVRKVHEGAPDDIRPCVKDNQGCVGRINQLKSLGCTMNPEVGCEPTGQKAAHPAVKKKKRVVVIGAGPSGMEAAWIARARGHEVLLFEQEDTVGGQVNLASRGAGRARMGEITRHLRHMLDKYSVSLRTERRATAGMVQNHHPDAVVVATGSLPQAKPFPGDYAPPEVMDVRQVLRKEFPVGDRVLFIDENGGHRSTATVELLADQGKQIDMLTSDLFIGIELAPIGDLYLTRQRLMKKGVKFTTDMAIEEIRGTTVTARMIYTHQRVVFNGYDTVIIDADAQADDQLYKALKDRVPQLFRVGDCVAPRGIEMAILEGRRIGEAL